MLYFFYSAIFPECHEQTERVNKWLGGETQALSLLQKRLHVEEMVRVLESRQDHLMGQL